MDVLVTFLAMLLTATGPVNWSFDTTKAPEKKSAQPSYAEVAARAAQAKTPLIVFVGVKSRPVKGYYVVSCTDLCESVKPPSIVVSLPDGKGWLNMGPILPSTATNDEIIGAVERPQEASRVIQATGVSERTAPFSASSNTARPDDSGPWLSRAESDVIKAAWPKSMPFPKGLKFYSLRPTYQKMYTMNNGRDKFADVTDIHDEESHPFLVSGGMAVEQGIGTGRFSVFGGWRSVKGLDLSNVPDGRLISVWREETDVRAFSLVPRWRWKFPAGTVAYDILSTDAGIFEIRTQERTEEDWASRVAFRDLAKAPAGYTGLGQSCVSCHSHAGEIVDVPGRIYRRERWGSDGRFSWRPYRDDGTLDHRWPIEAKQ